MTRRVAQTLVVVATCGIALLALAQLQQRRDRRSRRVASYLTKGER
jgi:hypothetical protein